MFLYILLFIFETANRKPKHILERRRKYERMKRKGGRCKDRRVSPFIYWLGVMRPV